MRCGVVEMSRLLKSVKGRETCFCALKLMVRELGRFLYIFNEKEGMGFGDVVFVKKGAGCRR